MLSQYPSIAPGLLLSCSLFLIHSYYIKRQWTAALRAIEGDEPSLTAAAAPTHLDVALENNTKDCVIVDFSKLAILRQQQK